MLYANIEYGLKHPQHPFFFLTEMPLKRQKFNLLAWREGDLSHQHRATKNTFPMHSGKDASIHNIENDEKCFEMVGMN